MVDSSSPMPSAEDAGMPAPAAPAVEAAQAPDVTTPAPDSDSPLAATLTVPPLESEAAEGGEWQLLVSKLQDWFASGAVQELWQQLRSPLIALAVLIGVVMLLKVYAGVIGAMQSLPLLPGLLELVGVIWLSRFAVTKLVTSKDRQALLQDWSSRWESFRGRG
ncbi:CAAD domain-containing protein [Synechococcus sp. CS-1328]|uniref:CAAD domain-containing protein n=1 Tax=Synechococcus sp. CS-1328 TaxID=2847976 RepID=UPI00223B2DE9|nr:CAAD domain-containing protein [Synechococcus sp. CS-1328]MCT0225103.1 CAAD domain-containing protein [Synechococcus sp. CS-1328]